MISQRIQHMGIVNVTPDSFSDGGDFFDTEAAVRHGKALAAQGADMLDIGGESSRPGSEPVSVEEELRRVIPVIERLSREVSVPLSVDTYRPAVARAALKAGATTINDITGLRDPDMMTIAAQHSARVIIMHMQGEPKTMQEEPRYTNVVSEVHDFFQERIQQAVTSGIQNIILDPGIGFGKTVEHNLEILRRLHEFTDFGYPLMVGASRKSFIGKIREADVYHRLPGTIAANVMAVLNGAQILRVHDVAESIQAIAVTQAIQYGYSETEEHA